MSQSTKPIVRLDSQGRLVLPASVRRQLGLGAGDVLVISLDDGRLVLEKPETIKRRLKARFAKVPGSLSEELIAERREEARQEAGE